MAFVLENISKEDLKRYGLDRAEGQLQRSKWVIDRERESFLIYETRDADSGIRVFILLWEKKLVEIFLYQKDVESKGLDGKTKHNLQYYVDHLWMPSSLEQDILHIKKAIAEALSSYGWNGSSEYTGKTTVEKMDDVKIIFKENIKI